MPQRQRTSKSPANTRHLSRAPAAVKAGTQDKSKLQNISASDEATVAYVKKVLCQNPSKSSEASDSSSFNYDDKSLEDLLPPLTSSNEIDLQLYGLICVILDLFVQSWYNRITPDAEFVMEVVQIIAHCTRGLEERLRHVDMESLLLDEIPYLLHVHLRAVETARNATEEHYDVDSKVRIGRIYHELNPHLALSPAPVDQDSTNEQQENETAWSQLLTTDVLALLLPPEDLNNPCLRVVVSEIFSEMIFHNAILKKCSEPWLLWDGLTKVVQLIKPDPNPVQVRKDSLARDRKPFEVVPTDQEKTASLRAKRSIVDVMVQGFWSGMHVFALVWLLLKSFLTAVMHASSLPPRLNPEKKLYSSDQHGFELDGAENHLPCGAQGNVQPIVEMSIWTCTCHLLSLHRRMPWLVGLMSLLQWISMRGPGQVCSTNSALDRLLSARINRHLLSPGLIPPLLRAVRTAIFPDNVMGPARVPPTPEEVVGIKHNCARAIAQAIPTSISSRFFATSDQELITNDVETTLDLFADEYINKHLIVGLVDLVVVRLFPELAKRETVDY